MNNFLNNDQMVLAVVGVIILFFVYCYFFKEKYVSPKVFCNEDDEKSSDFCPRRYCKGDHKKYMAYLEEFKNKYPCKKNYALLGYDNPYIYPYYYDNMNPVLHPVGKYKYPQWIQELSRSVDDQFPGYTGH